MRITGAMATVMTCAEGAGIMMAIDVIGRFHSVVAGGITDLIVPVEEVMMVLRGMVVGRG